jgi:hypothetical protein
MELRWGSYIKAPLICHGWVGKGTARARCAHLLDVQEHPRPVKLQADAMQHAKDIEMATNGIAMECHENDIPTNSRNKLKTGISFGSSNWLAVDQDPIFNFDMQQPQGLVIVCIKFCFIQVALRDGSRIFNKTKY